MPTRDRRHDHHAVHATPTGALSAVAVLLAVVLLLALAVAIINTLPTPRSPATAPVPQPPAIQHLVLITPLDRHPTEGARS